MKDGRSGDLVIFGIVGLLLGAIPAMLTAGLWLNLQLGRSPMETDLWTYWRHSPFGGGRWAEPIITATWIGLALWAACGLGAIAVAFRPRSTAHGSARWADAVSLRRAGLAVEAKAIAAPVFGKLAGPRRDGLYLTASAQPHMLVAAPSGAGKTVGVAVPTLLKFPGSCISHDPKGELYRLTAPHRFRMGDRVFRFAPYDAHGRTHRFNPVEAVRRAPEARRYTEARRLATGLIIAKGKGAESFIEGARDVFCAGVLLAVEEGRPTLGRVYDLLSRPGELDDVMASLARGCKTAEARKIFDQMAGRDKRTLSAYVSVLMEGGLNLWADRMVRRATAASDFDFQDFRRDPASLYIVVAPNDQRALAALVRVLFQQAIAALQSAEPGASEPHEVLLLMDEFRSLGRMEAVAAAMNTLRGYGGRLAIIVQSLSDLRAPEAYGPEGATAILANAGVQVFMAPNDGETTRYISSAVGDVTRRARSLSWRTGELGGSTIQERKEGAPLIRPEELRRLGDDEGIALIQNRAPARFHTIRYFEDRHFRRLFEAQSGPYPDPPVVADDTDEAQEESDDAGNDSAERDKDEEQGSAPNEAGVENGASVADQPLPASVARADGMNQAEALAAGLSETRRMRQAIARVRSGQAVETE